MTRLLPVTHLPLAEANAAGIAVWLRTHVAETAQLSSDTRTVQAGDIFLAYRVGNSHHHSDGRPHIAAAVAAGAAAIVAEADAYAGPAECAVPLLLVPGLHRLAGECAALWYGNPGHAMHIVGITGTNGKTSCSHWLAQALSQPGKPCAMIGTLGSGLPGTVQATGFTTPDAVQLQRTLAAFARKGAKAVAMEVSSHGLEQQRVAGTPFHTAVFTNLTQDHLDYHGTMAAYGEVKRQLFTWPGLACAVINRDDPFGQSLLAGLPATVTAWEYGIGGEAAPMHGAAHWLSATDVRAGDTGTECLLRSDMGESRVQLPVIGQFNLSNALAVLGALLAAGMKWSGAINKLRVLSAVPGRMEQFGGHGAPLAVVDYAHTPDALDKALQTLRPLADARQGRLWCVFGCGGDRDAGKRPLMGRVAAERADEIVLTSDNPRSEAPQAILAQIAQGLPAGRTVQRIEDRATAILYALKHAADSDVVLVAGKGHEATQEIQGRKLAFSDQEHVRLALATRGGAR
ncbi:MAG TPA: UDP-N-acetylmuramoyl-L-alanyl-D-glutamate--2,6-diaminopimelate ligase [Burkholderiaceae bacterium]|nr:UDP-N-acetylmuramoyl-L-alanyl-D-glutamate--2,6-diaminopimelate ligase [Burkholderiaceae bacterium]